MKYIAAEDVPFVDIPIRGRKLREAISRLSSEAAELPEHLVAWISALPDGELPEAPSYGEDSAAGQAWVRVVQAYDACRYSAPETVKAALQVLCTVQAAPEAAQALLAVEVAVPPVEEAPRAPEPVVVAPEGTPAEEAPAPAPRKRK